MIDAMFHILLVYPYETARLGYNVRKDVTNYSGLRSEIDQAVAHRANGLLGMDYNKSVLVCRWLGKTFAVYIYDEKMYMGEVWDVEVISSARRGNRQAARAGTIG